MNKRQREVFSACLETPPESDQHGWGSAYWLGYRNPEMQADEAGPTVGAPGSEARAAFMAGKSAKRRASVG